MMFDKKVLMGDDARQALKKGVDIIADAVTCTLGPRGKKVVLDRGISMGLTPLCTKDGVTVANHVNATDPTHKLGAHLCREAAQRTMDKAGDGTTSTVLLVQSMVTIGLKLLAAGANSSAIETGMDKTTQAIIQKVLEMSSIATDSDLHNISLVSANGDLTVSQLVSDAAKQVGKDGIMLIEESNSSNSQLTIVDGLQIPMGYDDTSPYFMTNLDTAKAVLQDCLIFLYEGTIGSPKQLVNLLKISHENSRPLLIIAGDYEPIALSTLVANKVRNGIEVAAIRSGVFGSRRREVLKDIAILTGGTAFTEDIGRKIESVTLSDLGTTKKVIVDRKTTILSQGSGKKSDIESRVTALRTQIESTHDPVEKTALESRLAGLAGGIAIFKVGADTDTAMKEKKDRVDDAMRAVRCAMASGIVPGGGIALLTAATSISSNLSTLCLNNDELAGAHIVLQSCEAPLKRIAQNAGLSGDTVIDKVRPVSQFGFGFNARTNRFVDLLEEGVVDPCSVITESLRNAASISSMILTTESIIAEIPTSTNEQGEL